MIAMARDSSSSGSLSPLPPYTEIVQSEATQTPNPPLSGHDLWPFNEERCACPDDTLLDRFNTADLGLFHQCSQCHRVYTRKLIK